MSKELHNLESCIKQGKYPNKIYKSNLVNFFKINNIWEMQKYKEDSFFERKSGSRRKAKYIDEHIQYILNLINTDPSITSTQIWENYLKNLKIYIYRLVKELSIND